MIWEGHELFVAKSFVEGSIVPQNVNPGYAYVNVRTIFVYANQKKRTFSAAFGRHGFYF